MSVELLSAAGEYLDMTPYILPDSLELMNAKDVSKLLAPRLAGSLVSPQESRCIVGTLYYVFLLRAANIFSPLRAISG